MRIPLLATAAVAAALVFSARAEAQIPVDVVGHMSAAQFSALIAPQSYKDWGNEPFIAVNPLNPSQVVVSGFGYGTTSTTSGSSIWYSTDAGTNWSMTFPFQAPANGINTPRDQTFAYDSNGLLHAVMLGSSPNPGANNLLNVYHGTTATPAVSTSAVWTPGTVNHAGIDTADQPWMAISGSHVYVAYDNFPGGLTTETHVARSDDFGATFTAANDLFTSNGASNSFTNPGNRIATDKNGNAYSIVGFGTASLGGGVQTVTYRLNSYHFGSSGSSWDHTTDTAAPGGILIDTGNSHQINNAPTYFGKINDLRGNITAIASDATGDHIYVVYGKMDGNGIDRLFSEEFHNSGGTLVGSGSHLLSIPGQRAALPSVTVLANGAVCVEYQSYVNAAGDPLGASGTFQVHLATSTDGGVTWSDSVMYTYTAQAQLGSPGFGGNRELGDYAFLTSLDNTVYGTFAAFGNVNSGGIDTRGLVVPFYFSSTHSTVPEPGVPALLGSLFVAAIWKLRRRR